MKPIVFTVCKGAEGWYILDHMTSGPFISKERAVDLAEGMAQAIRSTGGEASVAIDDGSSILDPAA